MNTKKLLGIIGSAILFVGVFTPIVRVPIMGSINYIQGDGKIVIALAVISFLFVMANNYKWLWLTGLSSLGMLMFTFVSFQSEISKAKERMDLDLAGNPFRGIADAMVQSSSIQWGWGLMIIGSLLVIASAATKQEDSDIA